MTKERRYILIILTICVLLASLCFPLTASFAFSDINYDNTDVLDDLNASDNFNIYNYGFQKDGRLELFNFVEYCYSPYPDEQINYGLYVYLYNPGNIKFKENSEYHTIQLATGIGDITSDYNKYKLKHLSASASDVPNLFHKFKVEGADLLLNELVSSKRQYNVSSIELDTQANGVVDYGLGGQYSFTGFAAGYNPNSDIKESTLTSTAKKIDVISLDVGSTFYRLPGESARGYGFQDNLSSIYFAIDNKILNNYDAMCGVRMRWDEYRTNALIVNNSDVFNEFLKLRGKDFSGGYNASVADIGFHTFDTWINDISFNSRDYKDETPVAPYINTMFYRDVKITDKGNLDNELIISSKTLRDYWKNYNISYNTGKAPGGKYSMDLFLPRVDFGRKKGENVKWIRNDESWTLEGITYKNGFDHFWKRLFGTSGKNTKIENIAPIYKVTAGDRADSNMSDRLYIHSGDIADFSGYYDTAKERDKSTYLVRFAVTDYFARTVNIESRTLAYQKILGGVYVEQTAFLNLDVLEVEFVKDGVFTRIPTVMSPIDVVGGITNPGSNENNDDWWKWLILVLGLILLIITSPIIAPIIGALIKVVMFIIVAPFKLIANIFRAIGGKEKSSSKASKQYKGSQSEKQQAKRRLKNG